MELLLRTLDYIANHPGVVALLLAVSAVTIYRKYIFKQLYLDVEKRIHKNILKHNSISEDVDKSALKALKSFEHIGEGKILFCEVMFLRDYFEREWHIYDDSSLWIPDVREFPYPYHGPLQVVEKNGCRITIGLGKKVVEYIDKPKYALHALMRLRWHLVHFSFYLTCKSIYWYYLDRDFHRINRLLRIFKLKM